MTDSKDKTTLVLGASLNESRFSNICIHTLTENHIPTVAVGLREGEVSGIKIHTGMPDFAGVHTITLYLGPQNQKQYFNYILSLEPKRIIFNPGTWNQELVAIARQQNIEIVNNCTLMMISGAYY
ncbi:MAG TPA: CoA-binding protein [Lentimicrobium sp.]|nr:CoA-binding protein [Lentimicrobium sp.]